MAVLDCLAVEAKKTSDALDVVGLYKAAEEARRLAYAPYSGFTVGAAILTDSGEVVTGGNVENGSYGVTICAERAAVVRAVAEGHQAFRAIAVAGDTDRVETLASCGACLQVLSEFDGFGRLEVIFPDHGQLRVEPLRALLPVQFKLTP
jgi:cytidine deaminase